RDVRRPRRAHLAPVGSGHARARGQRRLRHAARALRHRPGGHGAHRRGPHVRSRGRAVDLALKDIRRQLGQFAATIAGVGMLLAIVLIMNGIYRGNIFDGVWLIENTAADLWVVEQGRGGPFNESSRLPADAYKSVAATPGIARASPYIAYAAQRELSRAG